MIDIEQYQAVGATFQSCEAHKSHRPDPLYCELHHIVPRAWQMVFTPDVAPFPGTYAGQKLWDARTITLCRTGHGNVHVWIVRLMHAWEPGMYISDVATKVRHEVLDVKPDTKVFPHAMDALIRFQEAGGDLAALIAAGEWGQI